MTENTIEISVNGKWTKVPALQAGGKTILVRGSAVKLATIHDEDWAETALEDPEQCVHQLKQQKSGWRADLFTFAQKLPATQPKYAYPMEWDSIAVARTSNFKTWWESLPQETRKNVRRSQKRGVVVSVRPFGDEVIRDLVELNNESPMRQGRPNNHYGKTFEQVKKDYSSFLDRSDLICAYVGEEMVGLVKIVYRGEIASVLQCLAKGSHYDKRPSNAMLAKAVELCEARGIAQLTYGFFHHGNKRDNPLLEFKIRNGFEEVLVPRYYVPLTAWGSLARGLNLHRGMLGILPHSVIAFGVSARSRWYNFKQSKRRCSSIAERPNCDRQTERSNPPAGSNLQDV
jgi:hypothetical protein